LTQQHTIVRWEKTGIGRYTTTCLRESTWLLFIVIANDTTNGICLGWNLKGTMMSEDVKHVYVYNTITEWIGKPIATQLGTNTDACD